MTSSTIKHLVLSGGTVWGFSMLGILQEAIEKDFLKMDNIKTMWMTSVGTIIGVAFSLNINPLLLGEYFVKRPWETLSKKSRYSVLELLDRKGIIHRGFFDKMFSPLLQSVDLTCETTLAELYTYNGIEMHFYTTELNKYEVIDISFKTHPEWRIIDAIYASCSIPILFDPLIVEDKCYIDGGFFLNYPISKCPIENPKEIFGISLGNLPENNPKKSIGSHSSIFDFLFLILYKVIRHYKLFSNDHYEEFPYQIILKNTCSIEYFIEVLYDKEKRRQLVDEGKVIFSNFYIQHFTTGDMKLQEE
jgi:predicted acylesterase/phospholipase RssA